MMTTRPSFLNMAPSGYAVARLDARAKRPPHRFCPRQDSLPAGAVARSEQRGAVAAWRKKSGISGARSHLKEVRRQVWKLAHCDVVVHRGKDGRTVHKLLGMLVLGLTLTIGFGSVGGCKKGEEKKGDDT